MTERRRVAIVSQHLDGIGAKGANSVGICSRGLAAALADRFDVAIYGKPRRGSRQDLPGVSLRFIGETRGDRLAHRVYDRTKPLHPLFNRGYPITTSTSRLASPFWGRRVAQDLAEWNPDLVLVQHNARRVPPIKNLLPDVPVVLQLHQSLFPQERTASYRKAAMRADYVASVSAFTAAQAQRQLGRPVSVIRNGVRSAFFDIRRNPAKRGPNILFLAAVSPEKGVHVLSGAFARVLKDLPEATLTLVGGIGSRAIENVLPVRQDPLLEELRPYFEGDYRHHILESIPPHAAERIFFRGRLQLAEITAEMASADIFVLPSIWDESFGLPVVEAMAAGLPVIVSESGAMPWLVNGGRAGVIVPKGNKEALARAVVELWSDVDRRRGIAAAGQDRCRGNFQWSHAAEDLLSLVPDLLR